MTLGNEFLLNFVPLFVAIDALGTVPILISVTSDSSPVERKRIVHIAMITASILALVFLFLGRWILQLLGISVGHFAVAGGVILGAMGLKDMLTGKFVEPALKEEMVAVVPIGTPLIAGPATVTTLILLTTQYHWWLVLASLAANLIVAWIVFLQSNRIVSVLGRGGVGAFSKVMALLLAAIGVKMIFVGISLIFP
ncbi:MAG: MarC family protein [Dehalococcoidia bacterium]|nr:MarC family protein [Dehalococcoidia bacterium]